MNIKQGLLILVLILNAVAVYPQISFNPSVGGPVFECYLDDAFDGSINGSVDGSVEGAFSLPDVPGKETNTGEKYTSRFADSAVAYMIISPKDSVRLSKQVFDHYDTDGKLERASVYSWLDSEKEWKNKGKDDRFYYMSGKLKECQYYEWVEDIEHFTLSERERFKYKGDNISQYLFESFDPETIQRKSAHIEKYDKQGRLIYLKTQVKIEGFDWVEMKFIEVEYDDEEGKIRISARKLESIDYHPQYSSIQKVYDYRDGEGEIRNLILDLCDYPVTKADFFYDEQGNVSHVIVAHKANLIKKNGDQFSTTLKKNYYYLADDKFIPATSFEAFNRISHQQMVSEGGHEAETAVKYKTYYYYRDEQLTDKPARRTGQATAYSTDSF